MSAYCPVPVPSVPAGVDLCYVVEYYSVDDLGGISPDGYHNFATNGKTPTANYDPAVNLLPVHRRSAVNTSADYKLQLIAVPTRALASPNAILQVYTFANGDRREYVDSYPVAHLRSVAGA